MTMRRGSTHKTPKATAREDTLQLEFEPEIERVPTLLVARELNNPRITVCCFRDVKQKQGVLRTALEEYQ